MMDKFIIRPIQSSDKPWINLILIEHWGSPNIVTRGKLYNVLQSPGFIALLNKKPVGFITYKINNIRCEILTLNSQVERKGIGSSLVTKVIDIAREKHCVEVYLITTNDNLKAQKFYKKRGFLVFKVHKNAIEMSRKLKPEIPLVDFNSLPITDEIEMVYSLKLEK